jgi:hypothetical protein
MCKEIAKIEMINILPLFIPFFEFYSNLLIYKFINLLKLLYIILI